MERLTTHNELRRPLVISANERTWREIYKKLAQYEDAEEQGRLIVLLCKVGDTVYVLTKKRTINVYNIDGVIIDHNNIWLETKDGIYGGWLLNSLQFGLDVFLSREEAEKALENMK